MGPALARYCVYTKKQPTKTDCCCLGEYLLAKSKIFDDFVELGEHVLDFSAQLQDAVVALVKGMGWTDLTRKGGSGVKQFSF